MIFRVYFMWKNTTFRGRSFVINKTKYLTEHKEKTVH